MLRMANEKFMQVGILFHLLDTPSIVGTTNDWSIPFFHYVTNSAGAVEPSDEISPQLAALLNHHRDNDCVEVYFIGLMPDNKLNAISTPLGIVICRHSDHNVLAHELGHALGLNDIYYYRDIIDDNGQVFRMQLGVRNNVVDAGVFVTGGRDWGDEHGRGFYESNETIATTLERLLMYGLDKDGTADIPDGSVYGLSKLLDKGHQKVGASGFKSKNQEIYSR